MADQSGCACPSHCFRQFCACLVNGRGCSNERCSCKGRFCGRLVGYPDLTDAFATVHTDATQATHVFGNGRSVEQRDVRDNAMDVTIPAVDEHIGIEPPPDAAVVRGISELEDALRNLPLGDLPVKAAMNISSAMRTLRPFEIADFFRRTGPQLLEKLQEELVKFIVEKDERDSTPLEERPAWCVCKRCITTGFPLEDQCCGEASCMTRDPYFINVVTDPDALRLLMAARNDLWMTADDGTTTKQYRYHSYRGFILWQFGVLTEGDRRPLPSCCYKIIRNLFPNPPNEPLAHFQSKRQFHNLTHSTRAKE